MEESGGTMLPEKLLNMLRHGSGELMILADFDYTLSKREDGGRRCAIAHESLSRVRRCASGRTLGEEHDTMNARFEAKLSHVKGDGEKDRVLTEWWRTSHAYMVETGLRREELRHEVDCSTLAMRPEMVGLLRVAAGKGVPVVVLSAGITDVIQVALDRHLVGRSESYRVISNSMYFDEKGVLVGFTDPPLHSLNKCLAVDEETRAWVSCRAHCVLLGDEPSDVRMADAFPHLKDCCTIGIDEKGEANKRGMCGLFDQVVSAADLPVWVDEFCRLL